jgi:FMN phosphatase YigB (HAD superfamily)
MEESLNHSGKDFKIIFDFDNTLFSAKKWVKAIIADFKKAGVPEEIYSRTFYASKDEIGYRPEVQFKLIKKELPGVDISKLEEIFERQTKETKKYLYPDVLPFLEKAGKTTKLYLITYGHRDVQEAKLEGCGIKPFFEKIMIVETPDKVSAMRQIIEGNERAVFVEDSPKALIEAKSAFPNIVTVRINRGEGGYAGESNGAAVDYEVDSLDTVLESLLKYR